MAFLERERGEAGSRPSVVIGRTLLVVSAMISGVAACGAEQAPGVAGQSSDDLRATCDSVAFGSVPADPSEFPPWDEVADPVDFRPIEPEHEFFELYDWFVASKTSSGLTLFGVPREPVVSGPEFAHADLSYDGAAWVPHGWGQCRIELAVPGWGTASFVLDPAIEPDPSATTISVLAWERNCASGRTPEGRAVRPVIQAANETSVSIVVLVEPVTGGADCQGNPSFPLEIELGSALGDRVVFDARVQPARERPWPPTQASVDSSGADE